MFPSITSHKINISIHLKMLTSWWYLFCGVTIHFYIKIYFGLFYSHFERIVGVRSLGIILKIFSDI